MSLFRPLCLLLLSAVAFAENPPLQTVSKVDLQRYQGRWYEIARLPNRFEKKCASDVTATYTLLPNGKISVENTCHKQAGEPTTSKGTAKVVDTQTNAKLKVTFFWPFSGDYWVIALDPEYRWAVVGEPSRKYLWILSRTPSLPVETLKTLHQHIDASGYQSSALVTTPQTPASPN